MTSDSTEYQKEIQGILAAAEEHSGSAMPWRGEYLKNLGHRADEALANGKEHVAESIIQTCQKAIDGWDVEILPHNDHKDLFEKSSDDEVSFGTIAEYLESQKKYCINSQRAGRIFSDYLLEDSHGDGPDSVTQDGLWDRYCKWSEKEISVWDDLCTEYLTRIRFSRNLDFSEHLRETWGPYNTQFIIIKALERLKDFDREWLESYLMLYSSISKV